MQNYAITYMLRKNIVQSSARIMTAGGSFLYSFVAFCNVLVQVSKFSSRDDMDLTGKSLEQEFRPGGSFSLTVEHQKDRVDNPVGVYRGGHDLRKFSCTLSELCEKNAKERDEPCAEMDYCLLWSDGWARTSWCNRI
jgi:hypothetical protein